MPYTLIDPDSVGPLAARLRERLRISLRSLSIALAVTHQAIIKAETGNRAMNSLAARALNLLLEELTGEPGAVDGGRVRLNEKQAALAQEVHDHEMARRRVLVRGVLAEAGVPYRIDGDDAVLELPGGEYALDMWEARWGPVGHDTRIDLGPGMGPWFVTELDGWLPLLPVVRFLAAGQGADIGAFKALAAVSAGAR